MDLGSAEVERQSFAVERKGFDRADVTLFLQRVAAAMAALEEAARAAELRVDRLERDIRDLHSSSENGFHQLVATRALANQLDPLAGRGSREEEADRIVAAASDHAARLREQAELSLEEAMATSATIQADQDRLLVVAETDRDRLLTEARSKADAIVADAKAAATTQRADARRFAEELRELTAVETIELVGYAKAMAAAILETARSAEVATSAEDSGLVEDDVTIDLRDPALESEPEIERNEGLGGTRPSRYEARSAHLPQIGNEGASSAIDSIETLRDAR